MAVNNIELAVGQRWLTRGGKEVEIIDNDGHHAYPWNLSNGDCVTDQGRTWQYGTGIDDLDTLIQAENGFIPWNGGECPVPDSTKIEAKLRCGDLERDIAEWFDWSVSGDQGDIIAYRVVEQEDQPKQKKESTVETTVEVTEEPKYTVEQVFNAINEATDEYVAYTSVSKVKAHLANSQDPDYKLYLELKAKFEKE